MSKKNTGFRRRRQPTPVSLSKQKNRPQKRKQWTEQQMLDAIESATIGGMSGNAKHGVPPSTLKDCLSGRVKHGTNPGPAPYLNLVEEKELTDHLIVSAQSGYSKTRKDVINIVERYVNQSSSCSVSISNGWWFNFKKRNQGLSLRSGDSTAGMRMSAVNKDNINHYIDLLQEVFDEHNFSSHPEAIYNMDKTGMPLEPRPPKVIAAGGQKKVRYQTSGQKQQITVIGCGSATGNALPPFIIFAAKQINYLWTKNEVNGTCFAVSENGWIDQELFFFS